MNNKQKTINTGRHAAECKISAHLSREEIERDFINRRSPAAIAKQYKLANRASVYRHAHALGLFPKRQRNVRAALEKIIERAGAVEVNSTAVVSAVSAYARINAAGQWVERSQRVDLHQLFDKDLIGVNPDTLRICISKELIGTEYEKFSDRKLAEPVGQVLSKRSLKARWDKFRKAQTPTSLP